MYVTDMPYSRESSPSIQLPRLDDRGEVRSAFDVNTTDRPPLTHLFSDLKIFYQTLSTPRFGATLDLFFFTSLGISILDPNSGTPPRDIDLAVPDKDFPRLEDLIPTINHGAFTYVPDSMSECPVEHPLFPDIESRRLAFNVVWQKQPQAPKFEYGVEIFNNHCPQFVCRLLDAPMDKDIQIPTVEKDGFRIWHPRLTLLLYLKLQKYEENLGLKQNRGKHRGNTMLAAQKLTHALKHNI